MGSVPSTLKALYAVYLCAVHHVFLFPNSPGGSGRPLLCEAAHRPGSASSKTPRSTQIDQDSWDGRPNLPGQLPGMDSEHMWSRHGGWDWSTPWAGDVGLVVKDLTSEI